MITIERRKEKKMNLEKLPKQNIINNSSYSSCEIFYFSFEQNDQ